MIVDRQHQESSAVGPEDISTPISTPALGSRLCGGLGMQGDRPTTEGDKSDYHRGQRRHDRSFRYMEHGCHTITSSG
jgi:hypothetical protein